MIETISDKGLGLVIDYYRNSVGTDTEQQARSTLAEKLRLALTLEQRERVEAALGMRPALPFPFTVV